MATDEDSVTTDSDTERPECLRCGADADRLLVDPKPHPEANRLICCACEHEWRKGDGGGVE